MSIPPPLFSGKGQQESYQNRNLLPEGIISPIRKYLQYFRLWYYCFPAIRDSSIRFVYPRDALEKRDK